MQQEPPTDRVACGKRTGALCSGPALLDPAHRVPEASHDHDHHEHDGHDHHGHHHHGHDGHDHHGHHHGVAADADARYLTVALGLLSVFLLIEVVVALQTGSLALLSDAGHMLSDVGAVAGALWAMKLAARPAQGWMTFGWKRAEILVACANGITLLVVGVFVGLEAIERLVEPPPVAGMPVLIVALVGVVVNLAATWAMAKANRTSLNVEGAYQHVLTDLYGFIGTAVAGVIILVTGWVQADSIASLIVMALLLRAGWSLTKESGRVLLESAPTGLDLDLVREHLMASEHVQDVHELHAWTVTSNMPALSAHVVLDDDCFYTAHAPEILDGLQRCLQEHFAISHATLQLEPKGHRAHEESCLS